jgi:hypothetical protein
LLADLVAQNTEILWSITKIKQPIFKTYVKKNDYVEEDFKIVIEMSC